MVCLCPKVAYQRKFYPIDGNISERNLKRLNKIARALETTPESLLTIKSSKLENRDDKLLNTYHLLNP